MINSVILIGNLTKDPQFFKTQSGISYARFTVATTKKYKDNEETAFISCIAWRQSADFLNQYAKKGNTISVEGHITTGSYDDKTTGKKIYTTDVTVDRVHLIGRSSNPTTQQTDSTVDELEFDTGSPIDISDSDLPY
jgi:single-strand DNA-binding protein